MRTERGGTLREALVRTAREAPDRGVTIVASRKFRTRRSYPEMLATIRAGAARLHSVGVRAGDRVMVSVPTSWQWFESWLGALWLGAVPVALAPGASAADLRRLEQVMQTIGCRCIVGSVRLREEAVASGRQRVADAIVATEELADLVPASVPESPPEIDPESVAFLQLTSGSTSAPRAVMISHRAALHNLRSIHTAIEGYSGAPAPGWLDGLVSWLPLHHDMGLLGSALNCMVHGFDLCLLSPRRFVGDPSLWLEQLGQFGQAVAAVPNFGMQLCVDRSERIARRRPDLSRWRSVLLGGEMVQPETMESFARLYADCGFDAVALRPSYGLAEATIGVSMDCRGEGVRTRTPPGSAGVSTNPVACLGAPLMGTELSVTAGDGSSLEDGTEGEIRVRSPSLFLGYYGDPESTAEALEDGWLRTGDLGFMADGELYLTGRIKELLIVRGHNIAPHEIEWLVAETAGASGLFRSAAFSVSQGSRGEGAVLVLETGDQNPEARAAVERQIRLRVAHELKLPLADVLFVKRGRIPKTTSGKLRRGELRRRYLAGALQRLS